MKKEIEVLKHWVFSIHQEEMTNIFTDKSLKDFTDALTLAIRVLEEHEELKAELKWWHNLIRKYHDNEKCPNLKTYVQNLQAKEKQLERILEEINDLLEKATHFEWEDI